MMNICDCDYSWIMVNCICTVSGGVWCRAAHFDYWYCTSGLVLRPSLGTEGPWLLHTWAFFSRALSGVSAYYFALDCQSHSVLTAAVIARA
jgi:hypothetical protein